MFIFFFFNDTATTEIYTLSLHDALPIFHDGGPVLVLHRPGQAADAVELLHRFGRVAGQVQHHLVLQERPRRRSEEHTSELQSRQYLVCRLLLEKKKPTHTHSSDQTQSPI